MRRSRGLLGLVVAACTGFVVAQDTAAQAPQPGDSRNRGTSSQDATTGQPLAAPQPTAPARPNLQDETTFLPFVYGPLEEKGMDTPTSAKNKVHLLPATPATTQWGWFDNS